MRPDASDLRQLAVLVDEMIVKPRLSQVIPLTDARKAQELIESRRSHGKIVLKVA